MLIEWAAVSALVVPALKEYAAGRAKKLAEKQAGGILASLYKRVVPDKKLAALNQAFVARFAKELDSADDVPASLTADICRDSLVAFLKNPTVQDTLHAPLDGQSELDWAWLRGVWRESRDERGAPLMSLPEDFDRASVAKKYKNKVVRDAIDDPELRPVILALTDIRALEAVERSANAAERMAGPAKEFNLDRYADEVRRSFEHLSFGSVDTDWTYYEHKIRLGSVYVPQSVKQALPPLDLTRDYLKKLEDEGRDDGIESDEEKQKRTRQAYAELTTRPLMDVVDDSAYQRLVILGDPGLGKSTLVKRLALRWAEERDRPLTLLIELRQAARREDGKTFLDHLQDGSSPICYLERNATHDHLRTQPSLILFDGLDEVLAERRGDAVAAIRKFAADYPLARVIVTTRIHGYYPDSKHPEEFRNAGFEQFTLQDFDEDERNLFIERWYPAAFEDSADRAKYKARLMRGLSESPAITELASIPLLLTMMAILSRKQELPKDRHKLYEKCAELLLDSWDLEKFPELKGKADRKDIADKLGPDQKMRILERVAAAMQEERTGLAGNLISEAKLKSIVEDSLRSLAVEQPWAYAQDLIDLLRERNFMLAYLGDDRYAFVHRTFLEYFCAREFKYRLSQPEGFSADDLKQLFRNGWPKDEWHEVLRLLCGILVPAYATQCVTELLAEESRPEGHGAVLLAAQCLGEVSEAGEIREIRREARRALIDLIGFNLGEYLERGDVDAIIKRYTAKFAAVQALASGWKDDPDTLPLLLRRAENDDHVGVRHLAVEGLRRGWVEDLEVQQFLASLGD